MSLQFPSEQKIESGVLFIYFAAVTRTSNRHKSWHTTFVLYDPNVPWFCCENISQSHPLITHGSRILVSASKPQNHNFPLFVNISKFRGEWSPVLLASLDDDHFPLDCVKNNRGTQHPFLSLLFWSFAWRPPRLWVVIWLGYAVNSAWRPCHCQNSWQETARCLLNRYAGIFWRAKQMLFLLFLQVCPFFDHGKTWNSQCGTQSSPLNLNQSFSIRIMQVSFFFFHCRTESNFGALLELRRVTKEASSNYPGTTVSHSKLRWRQSFGTWPPDFLIPDNHQPQLHCFGSCRVNLCFHIHQQVG